MEWIALKQLVECGDNYEVSNLGEIRNMKTGRILKQATTKGYKVVTLSLKQKTKTYKVHRLVAIAFIQNPYNHSMINHKDECKTNNVWTNLEWCDAKYNCNYGTNIKRRKETRKGYKHSQETKDKISESNKGKTPWNKGKQNPKMQGKNNPRSKAINVYKINGNAIEYIGTFTFIKDFCNEYNTDASAIVKVCKGKAKQHKGFYFEYANFGEWKR